MQDPGVRLYEIQPDGTRVAQPLRAKLADDAVRAAPAFEIRARWEGENYVGLVWLGDEIVFEVVNPESNWHFDGIEAFTAYVQRKFAQCLAWSIETRT